MPPLSESKETPNKRRTHRRYLRRYYRRQNEANTQSTESTDNGSQPTNSSPNASNAALNNGVQKTTFGTLSQEIRDLIWTHYWAGKRYSPQIFEAPVAGSETTGTTQKYYSFGKVLCLNKGITTEAGKVLVMTCTIKLLGPARPRTEHPPGFEACGAPVVEGDYSVQNQVRWLTSYLPRNGIPFHLVRSLSLPNISPFHYSFGNTGKVCELFKAPMLRVFSGLDYDLTLIGACSNLHKLEIGFPHYYSHLYSDLRIMMVYRGSTLR